MLGNLGQARRSSSRKKKYPSKANSQHTSMSQNSSKSPQAYQFKNMYGSIVPSPVDAHSRDDLHANIQLFEHKSHYYYIMRIL